MTDMCSVENSIDVARWLLSMNGKYTDCWLSYDIPQIAQVLAFSIRNLGPFTVIDLSSVLPVGKSKLYELLRRLVQKNLLRSVATIDYSDTMPEFIRKNMFSKKSWYFNVSCLYGSRDSLITGLNEQIREFNVGVFKPQSSALHLIDSLLSEQVVSREYTLQVEYSCSSCGKKVRVPVVDRKVKYLPRCPNCEYVTMTPERVEIMALEEGVTVNNVDRVVTLPTWLNNEEATLENQELQKEKV